MIRFAVALERMEDFELFLGLSKTLGLIPEVGLGQPDAPPQRRSRVRAKRSTKKHKRMARNAQVKTQPISSKAPLRLLDAHTALVEEFGGAAFDRSLAKGVIAKRAKIKHPSNYITQLTRVRALVAA